MNYIVNNIFSVKKENFKEHALEVFRYQYLNNRVYNAWVNGFNTDVESVTRIEDIPFLPVSFFKTAVVVSGDFIHEAVFESSGTTQTVNSKHYVKDVQLYIESAVKGFEANYGSLADWCILGLLPSYLQRGNSSLVVMVDEFIRLSGNTRSGFYLYEYEKLATTLKQLEENRQKTLLVGVTFALLEFAERFPMTLKYITVMETGGMKGKRKELIRQEVHAILSRKFGIKDIHSEYGMTEMLSQAYSFENGIFHAVPWVKVLIRDEMDPLSVSATGRGILNIIDLANIHSCSFIATDDAAILYPNGSFEVSGRVDNSDIRGCSLLVS